MLVTLFGGGGVSNFVWGRGVLLTLLEGGVLVTLGEGC